MNENEEYVKILFRYHSSVLEEEVAEILWAVVIDKEAGHYKLDSIPFYGPLVSSEDIVFAEYDDVEQQLVYRKTIETSSNSTIQVVIMDDKTEIDSIRKLFEDQGCVSEKLNEDFFVMDVPGTIDYRAIKAILVTLENAGTLEYAEPCLSDVHQYD